MTNQQHLAPDQNFSLLASILLERIEKNDEGNTDKVITLEDTANGLAFYMSSFNGEKTVRTPLDVFLYHEFRHLTPCSNKSSVTASELLEWLKTVPPIQVDATSQNHYFAEFGG